jgi:hypothetical protein
MLALVYPRNTLLVRIVSFIGIIFLWLRRSSFRFYVHSPHAVHEKIIGNNFKEIFYRKTLIWQVVVYERPPE